MSIADTITSQLGPEGIRQISEQLGIDPGTARQAVAGAIPLLTGALARNAAQPQGARALDNALNQHDGSIFDQLSGFLGGGDSTSLGGRILGHVLGSRQEAAAGNLGRATGLDSSRALQLLMMLAPLVMGALGKSRQQKGFGLGDLAGVLQGETQRAQDQAPAGLGGLGSILDRDGDGDPMDDIARMGGDLLGGLFGGKK
jgi:hypothetical protein